MRTCCAACLSNCSDKISGEHVVTKGAFLADTVKVKGLSWCLDDFKTIGLASLVKNVLCTNHNSRLSEADAAAIQLRESLCNSADLLEARKRMPPQSWSVRRFSVNGFALERWCLKTLITIALGGKIPIGDGDSPPGEPPRALVETAFGLRQFHPPGHRSGGRRQVAGLHCIGEIGDVLNVTEGVVITTFSGPTNEVAGARFWFWGLNLLLFLNDGPAGPFSFAPPDGRKTVQPKTLYRPRTLHFSVHGRTSHVLEFVWQ
jgi:hypothetical protein